MQLSILSHTQAIPSVTPFPNSSQTPPHYALKLGGAWEQAYPNVEHFQCVLCYTGSDITIHEGVWERGYVAATY